MRDGYEKAKGRESMRANQRQKMFEAHHNESNAFVKHHEAMLATMGAKAPNLEEKYMEFDACMISDGEHAQEFGRQLTKGLDDKAYPVK